MQNKTSKTKLKTLFLIIGAVGLYLLTLSLIDFFKLPYKGILQLLLLLIIAVAVYIFTRLNLYIYECNIKDDELIFVSKLGEAEKLIANVSFESIEYVAPFGHENLEGSKEIYRYNAKNSLSDKGAYVLVFSDDKKKLSKLTFNPSEELLSKLKDAGIKVL